jgi:5-formyltetrahydrofolate cyclo-ligase
LEAKQFNVTKDSFRNELLNKLSSLSNEEIISLSFSLTDQIVKFINLNPELASVVGSAYMPLKAEIAPMYQELLRHVPMDLACPILIEGEMHFGIPDGLPKGNTWMEPPYHLVQPGWFMVPGVGFDLGGWRLGRGKGFYDRYLSQHEGIRIGLAWSEQIVEKIPVEVHDCHMDFIITESFCWDVHQQKLF